MDAIKHRPLKLLLLGGTTEATLLAQRLADFRDVAATLSLAGRTRSPAPSPIPVRTGGFGGADGLADYLVRDAVDVVIDATHPFAAQISNNAIAACSSANVPLLAVERPAWRRVTDDIWTEHATVEDAIAALPDRPANVFSALGRSSISRLGAKPQHRYIIRVVDPIEPPPELAHAVIISARGPFVAEDDIALFRAHEIAYVLAKNSGGGAAYAKIEAARRLQLPVHMVQRAAIGERFVVPSAEEAMAWIVRHHLPRAERGV
jgi:precorrin-6A/cobalt-precorrin-6A reductase